MSRCKNIKRGDLLCPEDEYAVSREETAFDVLNADSLSTVESACFGPDKRFYFKTLRGIFGRYSYKETSVRFCLKSTIFIPIKKQRILIHEKDDIDLLYQMMFPFGYSDTHRLSYMAFEKMVHRNIRKTEKSPLGRHLDGWFFLVFDSNKSSFCQKLMWAPEYEITKYLQKIET